MLQFQSHLLDFLALGKKLCRTRFVKSLGQLPESDERLKSSQGGLCYLVYLNLVYLSKALSQVTSGNMLKANNVYALWLTVIGCKKGEKTSFELCCLDILRYLGAMKGRN